MLASIMAALFFRVTNVGEYSEESRLSINDSEETNNLL